MAVKLPLWLTTSLLPLSANLSCNADLQLANILFDLINGDFDESRIAASTRCPVVWLDSVQIDDSAPSYLATAQPTYISKEAGIGTNAQFSLQIADMGGGKSTSA